MNNLITAILILPGPLIPLLVSFVLLRKRVSMRRCLFISGLVSLALFALCVAIPYYFQGYNRLDNPLPGTPLGWTDWPFVGTFAYLYTGNVLGFLWLCVGLFQVLLGEVSRNAVINAAVKVVTSLVFSGLLFELHKFNSTIHVVLE